MRVVVVVWTRFWGGLESHAVELTKRIAERGHDVRIACVGAATTDLFLAHDPSLPLVTLAEPSGHGTVLYWLRQFRALEADACVFEKGTLRTASVQFDIAARLAFQPYLVIEQLEPPVLERRRHGHRFGLPTPGLWWYRLRYSGWLRSLFPNRVICITRAVRAGLETDYAYARARTTIINNGVDTVRFGPSKRHASRAGLGLSETIKVVGTACRLVPQKGIDVAIRAFAQVAAPTRDTACLLIAGEGPERPELERLVHELGLVAQVRFLGFVRDTSTLIPAIDVFLVPSRIEAQGIVVLEALASGCDVIASAVGGIPEVADPVATMVPPDDAGALASAIAKALDRSVQERQLRAMAARRHVESHFDARQQCGLIVDLITTLGQAGPARPAPR